MSKIQVKLLPDIETMESTSLVQTILNIIPDNPHQVPGKWGNASDHSVCFDHWCDPGKAWGACGERFQFYQPV